MKLIHLLFLPFAAFILTSGCAPVVDQRDQAGYAPSEPRPKTEVEILRDDIDILRQHIRALEDAQAQQDLTTPDQERTTDELRTSIAALRVQVDALSREQERLRKEIVASLTELKKQASSRPRPTQSSGGSYSGNAREHTVQSGETLSAIAQAYGSSVSAIKNANGMNSDMVRVGQKLVVPVKE